MNNLHALKAIQTSQNISFRFPFTQKNKKMASILFYPGCALSAASPKLMSGIIQHLRKIDKNTDILYGCCGKPSDSVGLKQLFQSNLETLIMDLRRSKVKCLITACPNCYNVFKSHLNECVEVVFLWRYLLEHENPAALEFSNFKHDPDFQSVVIHDACVMGEHDEEMKAIRGFLKTVGVEANEFGGKGKPVCCGKKNMLHMTNPKAYMALAERRVLQAANKTILTYCQSCAHSFESASGTSLSLAEMCFGEGLSHRPQNGLNYWFNRLINAIQTK